MKHQISLKSIEQSTPISLFQQLSDTTSENLSGGSDGTCATCTVEDILITGVDTVENRMPLEVLNVMSI
ncbi:MAG: hypothetical protein AAGF98_00935 [Cyanobacteria bacterium P01_H01_bin.153]